VKLFINIGPPTENNYVDYTRYVLDGSLTVEDSVNVPTLTTFQLSSIDDVMVVPSDSSYVRIVSEIYAQGGGYLQAGQTPFANGKVLATGFVTNQPAPQFLGLNPGLPSRGYQQLTYNVNVTSDEYLLNCQTIPYIPAFVNQTDSEILAAIAEALFPGFFDTSGMGTGTLVPYYQYDPSQTWSDIAKTFADQNRFYYRVKDRRIVYQPFGVNDPNLPPGLGIAYDETTQTEPELYPLEMQTTVVTVPPVNDCIVIGDIEPQNNVDCYFVGDGFTSNFQLTHQVFQGTSSNLLEDDWTEGAFTTGTWIVNDPEDTISLADSNGNALGALNIVQKGTSQVYTPIQDATFIQAQNGLELGGGLNLQHGQIIFNDTAAGGGGLIGGLFDETTDFSPSNCLAGFQILGQPSLGAPSVFQVQGTEALMSVSLSISGTNTTLSPGNVFSSAGFGGASWLNGQNLYITSIVQNSGYFVLTCTPQNPGIIPGNYGPANDNGTITFGVNATIVTASGAAGIYMQPLYNGSVTGSPVVSQPNHQYVLQTWIGAQAPTRFTRPYTNLTQTATYGAQNLASSGTISWVITDVNIGNYVIQEQFPLFGLFAATPPPVVTQFSAGGLTLPPFVIYVLLSGLDLNVAINYTLLSLPPQGFLTVQSLTGMSGGNLPWLPSQLSPAIPYQLGFGMINQTAQISLQGEAFALSFYTDDIPSVGARLRFQSWAAGQSIARVQDPGAIATQAKVSGDSGIRSAIMQNLSPLPRTSLECEAAAAAAILDREYPQWQGSYTVETNPYNFTSLYSPSLYDYPHTGLFFWIYSPVRGVTSQGLLGFGEGGFGGGGFGESGGASGLNFFVNTVRFQVVELRGETLTISVDYGPDLYLEKLLPAFLESEQNLLVPTQTVPPPNPITLPQVLNASLPTLNAALVTTIQNSLTGNYIVVDLSGGTEPNAGNSNATLLAIGATGCEVRYVDNGWGTPGAGRVGIFTVDQFTLPRTVRDQTFYLRGIGGPLGGSGFTPLVSKFSKALRVVYPLVPSAPALVSSNADTVVLDYAGDVRDIYGLEVRAITASGSVSFVEFPSVPEDTFAQLTRSKLQVPLDRGVGVGFHGQVINNGNVFGIYNPPSNNPNFPFPFEFQLGDIVYVTSPSDGSFQGIQLLTNIFTATGQYGATLPETLAFTNVVAYFMENNPAFNGTFAFEYPIGAGFNQGYSAVKAIVPLTSLEFNYGPPAGNFFDPSTSPIKVNNYDDSGNSLGPTVPYASATQGWCMAVTGKLIVPVAGQYTLGLEHDDGAFLAIKAAALTGGGTASLISGPGLINITFPNSAAANIPIMGGTNKSGYYGAGYPDIGSGPIDAFVIEFTVAGEYLFEIDYAQWYGQQTLALTCPASYNQHIYPGTVIPGATGAPWGIGWFDYGEPYIDQIGSAVFGVDSEIATVQLYNRGTYSVCASGSISGNYSGVCTIWTQTPHGFSPGTDIIVGCGWSTFPTRYSASGAYPALPNTGAPFCGLQQVTNVLGPNTFQFVCSSLTNVNLPAGTWAQVAAQVGVIPQYLNGLCAAMPIPFTVTSGGASGAPGELVILQRPVFAPSDLVVNLLQPDIAETLGILQALNPDGVVSGISAYFFNLTWDYSDATVIPTFQVPALTGIFINEITQQVTWNLAQGAPDGYRIDITDPNTGQLYNQFTIDHPYNPVLLTQFQMSEVDFNEDRNITVIPFNATGDGIPITVFHPAGGGVSVGGVLNPSIGSGALLTSFGSYNLEDIIIWGPVYAGSASPISPAPNQVAVYKLVVTQQITVSTATIFFFINSETATLNIGVGLYSQDGTELLINCSRIASIAASAEPEAPFTAYFSPVTLTPGVYWVAQTSDNAGDTTSNNVGTFAGMSRSYYDGSSSPDTRNVGVFVNAITQKIGIAGNPSAAGVLPATLGGIGPMNKPTAGQPSGTVQPSLMLIVFQ
jgi:hypothetical protein